MITLVHPLFTHEVCIYMNYTILFAYLSQACWDDNFNGRHIFRQTDFLHSPLLDELKALEARVLAEFAVVVPSALVVDRYAQAVLPCAR